MPIRKISKEQNIDRLVAEMLVDFDGLAPAEDVEAEVRETYERLCRESKVTDFIPVLAARRVREHLRRRYDPEGVTTRQRFHRLQRLNRS